MIYLDHAATTPVPKAVADAMYTVLTEQYANPNAQYPFGQEMRRSVEDWRAVIAKAVGCEANQLFFTSCGTEGDNWAIRAACWQNRHVGRHIVTTAVEHHAVLSSWSRRAGRSRPSCRIKTATFPPNPFWRRCGRTRRWCP